MASRASWVVALALALLTPPLHAQTVWQRIAGGSADAFADAMEEARALERAGHTDEAIVAFERAQALAPERIEPGLHALRAERSDPAAVLARAEQLLATELGPNDRSRVLFFAALAHIDAGRLAEAQRLLEDATRFRADLPEAERYYGNLAELLMFEGELERAVLTFRHALHANAAYLPARVGIVVALERLDQPEAAGEHRIELSVSGADAGALRALGIAFLEEGEGALYEALLHEASGDFAAAREALEAHARSASAQRTAPEVLARLRARLSGGPAGIELIEISGCLPTQVARSPDGARLAVACDNAGILEGPVRGGRLSVQSEVTRHGFLSYQLTDLRYAPDGRSLRALSVDGSISVLRVRGRGAGEVRTSFREADGLLPQYLSPDGEQVLFGGSGSNGFQFAAWDASPVTRSLSVPASNEWMVEPTASSDERRVAFHTGEETRVIEAPTWQVIATVPLAADSSRFVAPVLSADGLSVVGLRAGRFLEYSVATARPLRAIALPGTGSSYDSAPSAIDPAPDGGFLVGMRDRVFVVPPR